MSKKVLTDFFGTYMMVLYIKSCEEEEYPYVGFQRESVWCEGLSVRYGEVALELRR